MPDTTTFNFPVDTARMLRAIDTPDDIGAVVRLHFEIDRALEHIVTTMVPAAQHLQHRFMDQRIRFLRALGLPEVRIEPAKVLNTIRNDFAHREKESLTAGDVDALEEPVSKLLGRRIPTHFALEHRRRDGTRREWIYEQMSCKEKFCMLGFFALSGIATIENDFSKIAFSSKL
ncbi:hypothetical protein RAD15_25425 [Bradyrhizobium sp. 14AA]